MLHWCSLIGNTMNHCNSQNPHQRECQPASPAVRGLAAPRRLTITIPFHAHRAMLDRSDQEGRSLSNLAAFLLETALRATAAQDQRRGDAGHG